MTSAFINAFRAQFPLLKNNVNNCALVYFDNAATTQKPQQVIDSYNKYYQSQNSNVHRASHALSAISTREFEQSRVTVQQHISAESIEEVIWTKGTTESLNLIAQSWAMNNLSTGDEILLSQSEHHANIVPWQLVANKTGAIIKVLPLTKSGLIDTSELNTRLSHKTKLVSVALIANVLGKINPVDEIIARAKHVGAVTVIDAAQAIAHSAIDVQKLGCDFLVFSAHKMYGPTGVGVLYGKRALLANMQPYQAGGEMIKTVSFNQATTFNQLPFKFEAGTPNISGVIAFAQALKFIQQQNLNELFNHEQALTQYCYNKLTQLNAVSFIAEDCPDIPLFSFQVAGHHNHDIAAALDSVGIAVRSGHHCAMPLMEYLNITGCIRVSLAPYNTFAEVDYLIEQLDAIVSEGSEPGSAVKLAQENQQDSEKQNNIKAIISSEEIMRQFDACKSWDARHRAIMLLGKDMPRMDKEQRSQDNMITGCESSAWLTATATEQGKYYFQADSDAKVIRGLLMVVLAAFNGKSAEEIKAINLTAYIERLGLVQHLSPSRGNGLKAIINEFYRLAGGN